MKKEHEILGLRVEKTVSSVVKDGKGGKFLERILSINCLNDADNSEHNHSRFFLREF